jgi:M3 family oligoendopeptidase
MTATIAQETTLQRFQDFAYQRPEMESLSSEFETLLDQFNKAESYEDQADFFEQLNVLRNDFLTMYNICHIRHTIDTRDAFYEAEYKFFNEQMPTYQALNTRLHNAMLEARFRPQFEAIWGKQLFSIGELNRKTFRPEILEDLQEENRLFADYVKVKAQAAITFQGETYNLSSLLPLEVNPDRGVREAASKAKWAFFTEKAPIIEDLYDKLVKTRHRIAQKLGYDNFVRLGYDRLLRSEYGASEVATFREAIVQHIVPLCWQLYQRQSRRLGLEKLLFFDEEFRFPSGNPKPKGDSAWIVAQATEMFSEMSAETHAYFSLMQNAGLMDLENKDGKATGGYCTYIENYRAPYIFSNFNGTSGDIDVLTHESGHAFQVYSSRNIGLTEYKWPTYEACEIHSMSMEFFAWPWMDLFFEGDSEKYEFMHLTNALFFLPYGCAVDEFQHRVYENPGLSPSERNQIWTDLEAKYLPQRDYAGHPFLSGGTYWQKQSHIFTTPFYYIDYVLAQVCAFQYWKWDRENHTEAWESYLRLCQLGGSKPFLELVAEAGLRSPFTEEAVKSVATIIQQYLNEVDDSRF